MSVQVFREPARLTLRGLAKRAAPFLRAAGAERAIVFGSYARGVADGYSDLDLAVVVQTDRPRLERPREFESMLDALGVPVDLMVFTPEEFAQGLARGYGVFNAIASEGVTIYAAATS
ncbi:MAG TPA: nucleotidyltransferase domain-containing protein [Polyangiaceae bacterium]|jgi:predicted nucleotidyltransferase